MARQPDDWRERGGMRTLLVEDDAATRDLIKILLALRGHEAVAFERAEEAWEHCQREFFPLILLDWMLPQMDGLQLCRRIRQLPDGEASVVVLMTGRSSPDDLVEVLDAGANDYISKPFDIGLFKVRLTIAERLVDEIAERRRAEQAQRFLTEASNALAESLDFETTLARVTQLTVPFLGDACELHLVGDDGTIRPLAATHVDPERITLMQELARHYPSLPDAPFGVPRVAQSGEPELYPSISDADLPTFARDAEHLSLLRQLAPRSMMIVPLVARGRTLGCFALTRGEGRPYTRGDLTLAEEVSRRAALAVDNARLYGEAQEALAARDEAHVRLRAVVEGATESFVLIDRTGQVVYASPATKQLTGVKPESLVGQPFVDLPFLSDELRLTLWSSFPETIELPPDQSQVQGIVSVRHADGGELQVEVVGVNLVDPSGSFNGRLFVSRDVTEREQQRGRRDALLRVARGFAAEGDADRVLTELLEEAVTLLGGSDGLVCHWDDRLGRLVTARRHRAGGTQPAPAGEAVQSASTLAAERRTTVIVNPASAPGGDQPAGLAPAEVAVPLLHEGRLLGVLLVQSDAPSKRFSSDDGEVLELLAGMAAATLGGLARARLEGVLLAARTAQHELSNQLALTVGNAELLTIDRRLPPELLEIASEALRGAEEAATTIRRLQQITHLEEIDWGPLTPSTINLGKSAG